MKKWLFVTFALCMLTTQSFTQPRVAWTRTYCPDHRCWFNDIYATTDGGYAMTGRIEDGHGTSSLWLLKVGRDGDLEFSANPYDANRGPTGYSLIQTDDGGYLIGGISHEWGRQFGVTRTDEEGEEIWRHDYGGASWDKCYAVIELKSDDFLLAGETRSFGAGDYDGYLIKIDGDGEVIWDRTYGTETYEGFRAVREVNGGAVVAGRSGENNSYDYWLIKVDEGGEEIWSEEYGNEFESEVLRDMTSCREGGFILCGWIRNQNQENGYVHLVRVNADGAVLWTARHNATQYNWNLGGITQMWDNGFVIVGNNAFFMRVDQAGNLLWSGYANAPGSCYLMSVVATEEGGMIAAGSTIIANNEHASNEALLIKLISDRSPPRIIGIEPDTTEFSILRGDSVLFDVDVVDVQGDSILYVWELDDEEISTDTSVVVQFPELGDFVVKCRVSDGELADSIQWVIHVVECYIDTFHPDSLDLILRRNETIDFSVDVRAVDDDPPIEYFWLFDGDWLLDDDDEIIDEDSASVTFNQRGREHSVEAVASRGNESDNVVWNVLIQALVVDWWPSRFEMTVSVDTVMQFAVDLFDPEADSISILWTLDGDSVSSDFDVFLEFDEIGQHQIIAYAADTVDNDTLIWDVLVVDPNAVDDGNGTHLPDQIMLYPPMPNPFNSQTTVRYALPTAGQVRLELLDINGRLVMELVNRSQVVGWYDVVVDGKDLVSGVYFVRMLSHNDAIIKKIVLIR
ncbi:MAG: T9SS type A sorting domain-containing protein [Candidatus Electryoneaceae bacterium]|nr:T9SS type A sorting domain-containing protein [Candidatus Electryoneaceae bacterium]